MAILENYINKTVDIEIVSTKQKFNNVIVLRFDGQRVEWRSKDGRIYTYHHKHVAVILRE